MGEHRKAHLKVTRLHLKPDLWLFSVLTCFIYLDVCVFFSPFHLYYIQRQEGIKTWVSHFSGLLISPKADTRGLNRKAVSLPQTWLFQKGTDWRKRGKIKNLNLEEVGWELVTDPRRKRGTSLSLDASPFSAILMLGWASWSRSSV